MSKIGFVGLGNMGGPMAANLVKAGHTVKGVDLVAANVKEFAAAGGQAAQTIGEAVSDVEIVISMLPAGKHVKAVYSGPDGIFENVAAGALLIDCSTIDVATAREIAEKAAVSGFDMLDAPVSGGVMGAQGATLTFMTGASDQAFARAEPILAQMGKNIIHAGGPGNGQAAKVCNNMLLGISMIGVSEAFNLADQLGLDRQKLFDISSTASGQCWSLTTYCPVPGPVETSPANNDYKPGFSVAMMLKDLKLSQDAAGSCDLETPLGAQATQLYEAFSGLGNDDVDFSGIIKHLRKAPGDDR